MRFGLHAFGTDDIEQTNELLYSMCIVVSLLFGCSSHAVGVRFLFDNAVAIDRGVILGDDMGLGKTVQTIALLAALLEKTGTGHDAMVLQERKRLALGIASRLEQERLEALNQGRIGAKTSGDNNSSWSGVVKELQLPHWCPILIAAPNSVVSHWQGDLETWGHFSVAIYHGKKRAQALERIESGEAEVLVCAHSMIQNKTDIRALYMAKTKWKLMVIDEFHKFKNVDATMTGHLRLLRDKHESLVIGLTGKV